MTVHSYKTVAYMYKLLVKKYFLSNICHIFFVPDRDPLQSSICRKQPVKNHHICSQISVNALSDCESTNALLHGSLIKIQVTTAYAEL